MAPSDGEILGEQDQRQGLRRSSGNSSGSTTRPNQERDRLLAAERRSKKGSQPKQRPPWKVYRRCSLCNNVVYTLTEWQLHIHGRRHLAKSERNNLTFKCEVCQIDGFESSSHHRQHLTSKAHFRRLNQRKRSTETTKVTPVLSTSKFNRNCDSNCGSESDTKSYQSSVRTPSP